MNRLPAIPMLVRISARPYLPQRLAPRRLLDHFELEHLLREQHRHVDVEQLNAAEKLKRERQASESPARAPASPGQRMPYSSPVVASPSAAPATPAAPAALPAGSFRCDGRTHCSQMNSCEEAKYFLRNCPDVKMDGDLDGIPCEDQWCNGESR